MLHSLEWLNSGEVFPPIREQPRITRYRQNAMLFDGEHFADPALRRRGDFADIPVAVYASCAARISQVIGNFDEVVSFPVLLNYQRLITLKMADLVCGERPSVSGATKEENAIIKDVRDLSDFDSRLYSTVIDISRYGDAVWRMYKGWDGKMTFTCWDPIQWYPIVSQDGTLSEVAHCLCWRENVSKDPEKPDWYLYVQIHGCKPEDFGKYTQKVFKVGTDGSTLGTEISSTVVATGLDCCAVTHLRAFSTTNSVYGYDDYMTVDSLLAEIMARVGQISAILDKHADPNITGPVSMLSRDEKTGEYKLQLGKFFATSPGEEQPKYMTWDGQLSSAFKQLEFLVNQMYILSEMGAALLGDQGNGGQAISGTAMRFKMVNPLAKARRIANSMAVPVRRLFSSLSAGAETPDSAAVELPIPYKHISVMWADGLPDDPRENIENAKLASGATTMMPLVEAIMEYFGRSNEEALKWIEQIEAEAARKVAIETPSEPTDPLADPNHPGPQDGTGVNPMEKGSTTGLNDFKGLGND